MPKKKKIKRGKLKEKKREKTKKTFYLKGPIHKTKIRVVGIGGGGNSIVAEIARKIVPSGKKKISFVVANTDSQALKKTTTKVSRFRFGKEITFGLGTGMNPELGSMAAKQEKEEITKILEGQDLLIFVASLGGGVGSGATPIFTKIAKKLNILTCGVFTLPFKFEGEKKMEIAKSALRKLRRHLNTLSIIPNERIFQIVDKKTPLTKALSMINKRLSESLEGLLEMIYQPGLINIDFADLRTILKEKGKIIYLNTVEVKGKDKGEKILKELISSPLYPYTIKGTKGILFNISSGPDLKLKEVNQISKAIWELTKGRAKIIFGITESKELNNKIKITLLAVGCRSKISFTPKKSKKKKASKRLRPTHHPLSLPPTLKRKKKIKEKTKSKIKSKVKQNKKEIKKKAKIKKTKIKVKTKSSSTKKEKIKLSFPKKEKETSSQKVRKNALQIKKDLEEEEKKILAQEEVWETPAFLRRK